MRAYEFYSSHNSGELHLLGILPERRTDPARITNESIINWARSLLGEESGINKIYYSPIEVKPNENGMFYPTPLSQERF